MERITVLTPGEKELDLYAGFFSGFKKFNAMNQNPLISAKKEGIFAGLSSGLTEKLLLFDDRPFFYIRYRKTAGTARIESMFPSEDLLLRREAFSEYVNSEKALKSIIHEIFTGKGPFFPGRFSAEIEENEYNMEFFRLIGFTSEKHHILMDMDIRNFIPFREKPMDITAYEVKTPDDMNMRVSLQNTIFFSEKRIPLEYGDVRKEMDSQSYIPSLSLIFRKDGNPAGYGQIIKQLGYYILINFGVMPEFRGMGLSGIYLDEIILRSRDYGIENLKLEVMSDNDKALSLYKNHGFRILSSVARMERFPD